MSKKVDWDKISTPVVRKLSPGGKYSSGKEMLLKAYEENQAQENLIKSMAEMKPAMQQLLMIRYKNQTPLKVMRSFTYISDELVKSARGGVSYQEALKRVNAGTELLLKSLDATSQIFILEDETGTEIELAYNEYEKLLINTDIYEVVRTLYQNSK